MKILSVMTIAAGLCCVSAFVQAEPLLIGSYGSVTNIAKIKKDSEIQAALKTVLAGRYTEFNQNLQAFHAPYLLANNKAVYFEGEKTQNHGKDKKSTTDNNKTTDTDNVAASAATIYGNGTIYAAIYDPKNKTIEYFGNDDLCAAASHPTMQIFAKSYPHAKKVERMNGKTWCATNISDIKDIGSAIQPTPSTPQSVAPTRLETKSAAASTLSPEAKSTTINTVKGNTIANKTPLAQKEIERKKNNNAEKPPTDKVGISKSNASKSNMPKASPSKATTTPDNGKKSGAIPSKIHNAASDGKIPSKIAEQVKNR